MKKPSIIDIIFVITAIIVGILGLIELVEFLLPYYSYGKLLIIFMLFSVIYYIQKQNITIESLRSFLRILADSTSQKSMNQEYQKGLFPAARYIHKYNIFLKHNRDSLVYLACIILFCCIAISLLFGISTLLPYATVTFFGVYLYAKVLGFRFDFTLTKSKLSHINTLRFFLIVFALFITCLSILLRNFSLSSDERIIYTLVFGILFLCIGIVIFFKIPFPKIRIFNFYNILSIFLICSLLGLLVYKNFSAPESEKLDPIEKVQEEIPEIISNIIIPDVIISDEATIQEQELVSEIYAISAGLRVGSNGGNVTNLQDVLTELSYFTGALNGIFDENLRVSLRNTLISECDWPESTSGIFGPQAKDCIDNLKILIP